MQPWCGDETLGTTWLNLEESSIHTGKIQATDQRARQRASFKAGVRVKWSINCWNAVWYFRGVHIRGKAMKIQTPLEDR